MIYIATHKKYNEPNLECYASLHVGAEGKGSLGYRKDNIGEHISDKNSNFCELTGLYWIWKNTSDEYKGLVHYRRYFGKSNLRNNQRYIYTYEEMLSLLEKADMIVPYIEYFKQNAKEELLKKCCTLEIFNKLEMIVKKQYPSYADDFDDFFASNRAILFNMIFCRRNLFDSYCEWLFNILFQLEKEVDLSTLNDYQKRLYGFLSERLLNVWINHNEITVKHVPIIHVEMDLWQRIQLIRRRYTNNIYFKYRG